MPGTRWKVICMGYLGPLPATEGKTKAQRAWPSIMQPPRCNIRFWALASCVQLFATPWTTACQASLSITNSRSPPKPMSIELVMPSSYLICCLSLLLLPSILPSIRVFSNESVLRIRWPNYWRFSFNISPSNEHPGLIFFRIDWLDLLAVQGTLKRLLQHHSSKASILHPSSVQSLSRVRLFATPWITACQASLSITTFRSLPKAMYIELVMPSNHLILCRPLLLPPSIFPSIRVFSNQSPLHMRWPKYWTFSFSISPSDEYPGLISFRMDWLDLLAVQGTLKSLLQHLSSNASVLQCSAFLMVQLSHPYMTTGKTIGLTRWTFVGKVMSLLFNMLSRLVITLLPRSKCLLISWLQSPSAVILEPPKIKSNTVSTVSPFISNEVMGPDAMILVFWMLSSKSNFHSPLSLS